jgi:hypothetical protein
MSATDGYLDLRDRIRKGEHLHGRSFASLADAFITPPTKRGADARSPTPIPGCLAC